MISQKQLLLTTVFLLFGLLFSLPVLSQQPKVKHPETFTIAQTGTANTLDPAYIYDTASSNIVMNIYETLLRFPHGIVDADQKNVEAYSVSRFEPLLATKVPSKENGLIRETEDGGMVYEFPIREGVTFHEGGKLTPEDVEYSFERAMIYDRTGGPSWMILKPLTGYSSIETIAKQVAEVDSFSDVPKEALVETYNKYVDPAVEVDGNSVIFNLPEPYPPFLTILTNPANWSAVLDKEWVVEQGGWPGTAETWVDYHDPGGGQAAEESPIYDVANGTGPFKLERWDVGTEVVFSRYEDYWRQPAQMKNVVFKVVKEWSTRRQQFLNGDVDIVYTPLQYLDQVEGAKGVSIQKGLPTIQMSPVAFFTQDVKTENNDLVGSGDWGDGIPSDFFNDIRVRKAFIHAFDYQAFIDQVLKGLAYKTNGPIPKNMQPFYNDELETFSQDLDKAEALLKEAHGGTLWKEGFTFTMLYNTGNEQRKVAGQILEANIERLNPKFEIKIRSVDWSTYLDKLTTTTMPIFIIGWSADFPDPHNFAKPFMASDGTFSGFQGESFIEMAKKDFDPLIQKALKTVDTDKRQKIYYELQKMAQDRAIDLWLPQPEGVRVMRSWVQDVPFNPIYPDEWAYCYPIYKGYE